MSVTTMLFGFILVISGSFPNWLAAEPLAPYAGLRWSGATLTLLGCSFAVWARMALGANWSGRPTVKSGHQLIVGGPYAFARHPIYTGLLVAAIGTTFADLQWPRVLGVAIIAGVMLFKIRQEESLMMDTFPDTYPRYRQNVKALIPGLF
jgi:protein-S-isoprenylcysteine O-methyltransferase Ste14